MHSERFYLVLPLRRQLHPSCLAACWEFPPPRSSRRSLLSSGKCLLCGPWSTCGRSHPWSTHHLVRGSERSHSFSQSVWNKVNNPIYVCVCVCVTNQRDRHCLPSWRHYEQSSCWLLIGWHNHQTSEEGHSEWSCRPAGQARLGRERGRERTEELMNV